MGKNDRKATTFFSHPHFSKEKLFLLLYSFLKRNFEKKKGNKSRWLWDGICLIFKDVIFPRS
jgi:hypothetical protein